MPPKAKRTVKCTICKKEIGMSGFRTHMLIHQGIKPFKCQYCPKAFVQKVQCTVHERRHTGETPFKCPECDKGFRQRANLVTHQNNHHSSSRPAESHSGTSRAAEQEDQNVSLNIPYPSGAVEDVKIPLQPVSINPINYGNTVKMEIDNNGDSSTVQVIPESAPNDSQSEVMNIKEEGRAQVPTGESVTFEMLGQRFAAVAGPQEKSWKVTLIDHSNDEAANKHH